MSEPRCAAPLSLAILSNYWLGEVAPSDEAPLEVHLLGCSSCSRRLQWVIDLAEASVALARDGVLRVVVGEAFLVRLAGEGRRVREYRVVPGGSVECTVTPEDDLMVVRLVTPFAIPGRCDLALCDAGGGEFLRVTDVPVEASRGEVVLTEPIDALRRLSISSMRVRLIASDGDREQVLGEYTFNHTPSDRG